MEIIEIVTSEEARKRLLLAYTQGREADYKDFVIRPLLNPIDQRDANNKRKAHPLAIMAMVMLVLAVLATFFFNRH